MFGVLVAFRLIFAVGGGAAASMLTAVLGDFVIPKDLGKASGVMGLMSGLGALFGVFVQFRISEWLISAGVDDTEAIR